MEVEFFQAVLYSLDNESCETVPVETGKNKDPVRP